MTESDKIELLTTPELAAAYITSNDLDNILGSKIEVSPQVGGLANFVYRIDSENGSFYLKQRPPYIKTRPELPRVPREVADEIHGYEVLDPLMPEGTLPRLVHTDYRHCLFITTGTNGESVMFNDRLSSGDYSPKAARRLGAIAAHLHGRTLKSGLAIREPSREKAFYDRQYQWLVRELPYPDQETRDIAVAATEKLRTAPKSLIWGDLSPKNVLLDGDIVKMVDLETVHQGDAAFDLGYLTGHIMLEGLKSDRAEDAMTLASALEAAYSETIRQYAEQAFVADVTRDAILLAGTSILHRTLAALVPEARTQNPVLTERIIHFAKNLIKQEVKWSN